jgi:protein gp37
MADQSKIEWTDSTWQVSGGCDRVSEGCRNCYAERLVGTRQRHLEGRRSLTAVRGDGRPHWTGEINLYPQNLDVPFRWERPRRVFVDSLSDLFHGGVPFEHVDKVFAVMALCPRHTFQVLTKRPERMREYLSLPSVAVRWQRASVALGMGAEGVGSIAMNRIEDAVLPNVWLGTSAEDQETADRRTQELAGCPAAVRFLSCEPLLGPVDLDLSYPCPACGARGGGRDSGPASMDDGAWDCSRCEGTGAIPFGNIPEWVIVGGESGPSARACDLRWVRDIVAQCRRAGVPVFVKQLGSVPVMDEAEWRALGTSPMLNAANHAKAPASTVPILMRDRKGGDMAEWPADLRVREFPSPITVAERVVA